MPTKSQVRPQLESLQVGDAITIHPPHAIRAQLIRNELIRKHNWTITMVKHEDNSRTFERVA